MESPVKVSLTIDVLENGQVRVNGPLQDKAFCYGILQLAMDSVRFYRTTPLIEPATPGMINRLQHNGGQV